MPSEAEVLFVLAFSFIGLNLFSTNYINEKEKKKEGVNGTWSLMQGTPHIKLKKSLLKRKS